MDQTYPLRLLQNAWQQTAQGQGQILLFADRDGTRLGPLVEQFRPERARIVRYRLGPETALYGYSPLIELLCRLYDEAVIDDIDDWLERQGTYPPNRPIWHQLLADRYLKRPPLRLKDHVIQQSLGLGDDLLRLLASLSADQPVLVVIADGHWAGPALRGLLSRHRGGLAARLMLLVGSDPDQLPANGSLLGTEELEPDEPTWLIDLPPDDSPAPPDWPRPDPIQNEGIPALIQQALQNHALLCHSETRALCDRIGQMLDERQIILAGDHRYELMLVEAESLFYSDRYNGAITLLTELLEVARQDGNPVWQFDAYLRLAWCGLHKYRLVDAWQMLNHARSALEVIDDKDADWLLREREWLLLLALIHGLEHRRLPAPYQHRLEALLPLERTDDFLYAFRFAQVSWEASLNERERHFLRKALVDSLARARRLGNRVAAIKVLHSMAGLQARAGRTGRALTCLTLALRLCQPLQSAGHEVPLLGTLGMLRLSMNELAEARDTFHHALERLQRTAHYNEVAATLNNLAWVYFVGGNLSECERLLGTAIRLCRSRGFRSLPYYRLDDLLLHQALCRYYLGKSVLAQRTLLELNHRRADLSRQGALPHTCLALHFARAEADYAIIDQLQQRLDDQLARYSDLPDHLIRVATAARDRRADGPASALPWMTPGRSVAPLASLPVDVMSLLRSAELEGEVEKLQQRVRDTRLLSHLSAQANAATDADQLIHTLVRQLSAHLDCDYVAIDLGKQAYMAPTFVHQGLSDDDARRLHQGLALRKLTRGRLLLSLASLDVSGFDSGYVYINSISLPHHDFGDLVLMTRQEHGFEESVLRTTAMLAAQLAAAIQRLMHERELQHLSSTDMLTGLINRQALYPRLEEELSRARRHERYRFCLGFLDLDNFKYLNDHYGHNLGDRVLSGFARLLDSHTRTEDIAARLGGDEFVILFPGQSGRQVRRLSSRLLAHFATPEACHQALAEFTGQSLALPPEHCLGCSMGVVEVGPGKVPGSVDLLLNQADQAMYAAKSKGKNQAVVHRSVANPPGRNDD